MDDKFVQVDHDPIKGDFYKMIRRLRNYDETNDIVRCFLKNIQAQKLPTDQENESAFNNVYRSEMILVMVILIEKERICREGEGKVDLFVFVLIAMLISMGCLFYCVLVCSEVEPKSEVHHLHYTRKREK